MIELVSNNKDISITNENSNKINLTSNYSNINLTTEEENIELKDDKNYIEFSASSAVVVDSPVKSVNGKVGDVVLTAADVGALPDTTIIPDTTGLATEDYVKEQINNIEIPTTDLTGLATESYVDIKASEETTARVTADINLQNQLEEEIARASAAEGTNALAITNLQNVDRAINNRLDAEVVAREEAHLAIREECKKEIDEVKVILTEETARAIDAETALQRAIEAETANRDKAINEAISAIPEVDLTGYATESYVDSAIEAIPEVDLSAYAKTKYVDEKVAAVVDTAPEALNTLSELAAALGNDKNFATTVSTEIGKKVDKVDGKELSSNDFTNAYKSKLDGIAANANNYTHPATHPVSIITGLSTVATTGSYNDLSNKPTIPAAYTHPTTHPVSMITGLATVATSGKYSDLSGKPSILTASNKGYNGAITAGGDGVAEMGKYIDFHNTSDGTSDYSTRFVCSGEYGNTVNLPSATGTLTIGDKAYKIVVSSSAPTTTDTSIITFVI